MLAGQLEMYEGIKLILQANKTANTNSYYNNNASLRAALIWSKAQYSFYIIKQSRIRKAERLSHCKEPARSSTPTHRNSAVTVIDPSPKSLTKVIRVASSPRVPVSRHRVSQTNAPKWVRAPVPSAALREHRGAGVPQLFALLLAASRPP